MPAADAFEAMLIAQLPRLRAFAIMLTRNRSAADDLMQETALRALRFRDKFILGTSFSSWTYQILRNEFVSTLRRSKRMVVGLDDLSAEYITKHADQEDTVLTTEILRAMSQLALPEREILTLIAAAGLTYIEAAEHLNISIGTVRSRLWRARNSLADLLLGSGTRVPACGDTGSLHAPRVRMLTDGLT